jgi:hypothetical protein
MKKLVKYFVVILVFLLCNYNKTSDKELTINGYYGLTKYFQSKNTNSDYIETFLLKIDKDQIIFFGTVQGWGRAVNYKLNKTNDTILLGQSTKIYTKKNDNNILYLETNVDNKIEKTEYIKMQNLDSIIDKDRINFEKFGLLLNNLIIAGKYKYKDKIIIFNKNGKVENLDEFKNYIIRPRGGTSTVYDNKIIETENGIWKYQKQNDNLLLTKYTNKIEENGDMYILGNEKIELKKITSH